MYWFLQSDNCHNSDSLTRIFVVVNKSRISENKIAPFKVVDEKETLVFVIIVDMIEKDSVEGEEEISSGWVVSRTLTQFQELHRKLRPLCSNLKNLELPSQSFKFLFGKSDKNSLEKAKAQIQKYLQVSLNDVMIYNY